MTASVPNDPSLSSTKSELRVAAFARRQALSDEVRAAASHAIANRTFPVTVPPGAVIAGYSPIRRELDPHPLLRALRARGARTAMPTIAAQDAPLIFRAWRDGDPLQRGALGIHEPLSEAEILVPDFVLVPLAAFDRAGHRIGYGAGHYDRALSKLRLEKPIVAIGLAFAVQEVEHVPAEPHDVPLDHVLTEKETISFRSA
jgi:5-formyltetrahydrofolate cyclo-ligase